MEHLIFFLSMTILLLIILVLDRKNFRNYIILGFIAIFLDFIWEMPMVYMGVWYYSSEPMVLGISLYPVVLYFHWMCFTYFLGGIMIRRFKNV